MADFGSVQIPQNPLLSWAQIQQQGALADATTAQAQGLQIKNQSAQQDLTDRNQLYGIAAGLAARDPGAMAQAATLGDRGTTAVTTLSNADHNLATDRLAALTADRSMIRFPGLTGPVGGMSGATGGQSQGGQQSGSFEDRLGGSESADPTAVNAQGFAGQFQFGTARLADLGLYQPAAGEDLKTNHWQGQLNIPNFPEVKTLADFRNNLDAQRAAFGAHIQDIDQVIANTPGAENMSQDGLRAVAHLGGVEGMRKFIASGGAYNPADANGTTLAGYYTKFSAGGPQAFQGAFGHPAGRLGTPPGQAQPGQPIPLNTQVASSAGTPGLPQTTTDGLPATAVQPEGRLPVPPIPPAGGPPAASADGDVVQLDDRPGQEIVLPQGTRYQVGNGPVLVRGAGAWTPGADQPGAAGVAGIANPNPMLGVALAGQQGGKLGPFWQVPSPPGSAPQANAAAPAPGVPGPDGVVPGGLGPDDTQLAALGLKPGAGAAPAPAQPSRTLGGVPLNPIFSTAFPQGPSSVAAQAVPAGAVAPLAQGSPGQGGSGQVARGAGGPQPVQPAAAQVASQRSGLPPGAVFAQDGMGQFVTKGHQPGYALAAVPNGQGGYTQMSLPMPGSNRDLKFEKAGDVMLAMDPRTGLEVARTAIPDTRRPTFQPTSDGTLVFAGSQQTGQVLPPNTRPQQAALLQDDYKQVPALSQAARAQEDLIAKSVEMRNQAEGLPTGYGGEGRAKISSFLQTYFPDAAKSFAAGGFLPDAAQAEQAAKLMMQQSALAEKANGGSGGLGLTEIYMRNNPNLNMQPESIRNMSNLAAVTAMSQKDYLQGKLDHIDNQGRAFLSGQAGADGKISPYMPAAAYDRSWFRQDNVNTYMGAVNAMNGKPFEEWSRGLSPANAQRALGVVARIDPTATVRGRNGMPLPVSGFMPANMTDATGAVVR